LIKIICCIFRRVCKSWNSFLGEHKPFILSFPFLSRSQRLTLPEFIKNVVIGIHFDPVRQVWFACRIGSTSDHIRFVVLNTHGDKKFETEEFILPPGHFSCIFFPLRNGLLFRLTAYEKRLFGVLTLSHTQLSSSSLLTSEEDLLSHFFTMDDISQHSTLPFPAQSIDGVYKDKMAVSSSTAASVYRLSHKEPLLTLHSYRFIRSVPPLNHQYITLIDHTTLRQIKYLDLETLTVRNGPFLKRQYHEDDLQSMVTVDDFHLLLSKQQSTLEVMNMRTGMICRSYSVSFTTNPKCLYSFSFCGNRLLSSSAYDLGDKYYFVYEFNGVEKTLRLPQSKPLSTQNEEGCNIS